jgi:hypothetical protein
MKGRSERHIIFQGEGKSITLLKGSQATPARPSDTNNVKVKMLEWQEVAFNRQWNFEFLIALQ